MKPKSAHMISFGRIALLVLLLAPRQQERALGAEIPAPGPWSVEGWFTEQAFAQTFHFNRVPVGVPLTVSLQFEGPEEVVLEELGIHGAGGAVAREFERGVALANPSPRPEMFDLARLFPGGKFRRLKATPNQDTAVNNGAPVRGPVRLGEFDGLFLVRE
ncbi:MAG: hypothetical protein N2689_09505 [Verrucomicrobiae bacterium]|nr:hypothetical protein [Verrucomicrobiae bacterium]